MNKLIKPRLPGLWTILVLCCVPGLLLADAQFKEEVQLRIGTGAQKNGLQVAEQHIYGHKLITDLYLANGYKPVWNNDSTGVLQQEIQNLHADGLNPADYWFGSIDTLVGQMRQGGANTSAAVDLDILLSEAFIRAYYNLLVGKVDPERLDQNVNFSKPLEADQLRPEIVAKVLQGNIAGLLAQARPQSEGYSRLKETLARYGNYQANGGWSEVQGGKTLKPGDMDARVASVRARLAVTGDYAANVVDTESFDASLESAVKNFQARHGLEADGAIGAKTIVAMNVTVDQRIDQVRVNLERLRWYDHENNGEFIVADIAGYYVHWIQNGQVFWSAKAQVGRDYTQTPVFKDTIRYIEFNPTWTIPAGILRRSTLPGLKKDPDYLAKKGFLLLNHEGKEIDPKSVDWSTIDKMPYIVRQPPGPDNALGLVKFMFPNEHAVYLHDTNHREHFADTKRSFSSGCVRVDKPFEFAEKLLAGQGDWNRRKIDDVVASGATTRVNLEKPIRIIIVYGTAVESDGHVHFREDIYNRDARVLKSLDAQFKSTRPGYSGQVAREKLGKLLAAYEGGGLPGVDRSPVKPAGAAVSFLQSKLGL